MPLWRKGFRFGRLRVTLADLFTADDTKTLDTDEINRRIDRRLSGADTAPPDKPFAVLRARRLLEGLENLIYYCPFCEREFTLETEGNVIRCTACGCRAVMDRCARLAWFDAEGARPGGETGAPLTVREWFRGQSEYEAGRLREDMEAVSAGVIVRMPGDDGEGVNPCGEGELRLCREGWRFEGTLRGERAQLFFPIEAVPAIPIDPNDNFQIYSSQFYMFTPTDNPRACSKYSVIGECAYHRFAATPQMTIPPT